MNITLITSTKEEKNLTFKALLQQSPKTLLFFYPKDNTPWCSLEARTFSSFSELFSKADIQIIGVSRDSQVSHCSFITKESLNLSLISDPECILHKQFGARGEKKNYGKIYEGTIRSTFLLDQDWTIIKAWKNVKATWHAERVVKDLELE